MALLRSEQREGLPAISEEPDEVTHSIHLHRTWLVPLVRWAWVISFECVDTQARVRINGGHFFTFKLITQFEQ